MAQRKRSRRKPRGTIGYVEVGRDAAFQITRLPDAKEEVEQWILDRFMASLRVDPFDLVESPIRNPEAHFDFTLRTKSGIEYLDLMEIAILPDGGGFARAPAGYFVDDMAEVVFARISKKSRHYGARQAPLHLLTYATDWRFILTTEVLERLALHLHRRHHVFSSVSYFAPFDDLRGEIYIAFPASEETLRTSAQKAYELASLGRRQFIAIADPGTLRAVGPGTAVFSFPGLALLKNLRR